MPSNNIVGQIALFRFPLWEDMLRDLMKYVDALYLRFDGLLGDREILNNLDHVCGDKLKDVYVSKKRWNGWIWREEMIRMLDVVKPEMVMCPDEDEMFDKNIIKDIEVFKQRKDKQMAFVYKYPMPTEGRIVYGHKPLPSKAHVKLYKWKKGLTYFPYLGRARITNYGKKYILGKAEMLHYCYYTEEMRNSKLRNTKEKEKWIKKQLS